ncbi:hypothetical protein BDN71DRAFT_1522055 [Pleurotus eryngii]|uniref:CxC6 like cysteine cluster associated with KDZ domain-containing protein n=1 Tax=Pleurotus eryngii TaxID=5323 RepID=A0A9P5ZNJ5_PLEER|nr:hypothetical protein BDN71DRAFT_1522055 [Pleurotus eryngii]
MPPCSMPHHTSHTLTPHSYPLATPGPWSSTPTHGTPLAPIHRASTKPRSTRSATKAMQQELIVEIPVTKKPTKTKKKKNITARTLQESGAPLAPPARRVGTGVTLAPITLSITTSCIRHEEPEDVPRIATKDKGKGRDLTNLGSSDAEEEKDEGEDAEAEKSDEEGNEEKDADAGSNGDENGELKKTDNEDDDEDNAAEVPMPADLSDNDDDTMEVDPTTPKRPATPTKPTTTCKHRASTSPTTARQMGTSRTMGGFARGKAMGVALNMADFATNEESDALPVMGMLLVFKDGGSPLEGAGPVGVKVSIKNTLGPVLTAAAKKMVALTNSDILLWDAEDHFWEAKGPYATAISELVTAAYVDLGDGGIIRSAVGHSCDECCHAFKDVADVIPNQDDDPAALAGHDENRDVPEYAGPAVAAAIADAEAMDVDNVPANDASEPAGGVALHTNADVHMVVIDGIVMGPRHCAIAGCEAGLLNAQTGVFCQEHEEEMEDRCRMKGCNKNKVGHTQACEDHQEQWRTFRGRYANTSLLGVQRILRRAQEERQEWLPHAAGAEELEHDNLEEQEVEERKFAKAEGVAKILCFLEDVYEDPNSQPSYIAIDKGCALLKHIVKQHHWPAWEPTTRIIVNSYHYINHRVTDYPCRTWCNPAPLNGPAPNLVVVDEDKEGRPYYKRAFNTQLLVLV